MLIAASRRLVTLVVLSFATLGFLAVPIGDQTGYQHTRSLLATPEAGSLGARLFELALQLRDAVLDEVRHIGAVKEEPVELTP